MIRAKIAMAAMVAAVAAVFLVDQTWHPPIEVVMGGLLLICVACPVLSRWASR